MVLLCITIVISKSGHGCQLLFNAARATLSGRGAEAEEPHGGSALALKLPVQFLELTFTP
jgi:hypothetical protein